MNIYLPASSLRESAEITQPLIGEQLAAINLMLGVACMDDYHVFPYRCHHLSGWLQGGVSTYGRFLYEYGMELSRVHKRRTGSEHPTFLQLRRSFRFLLMERLNVPSIINSVLFLEQQRGRLLHEGDKSALVRRARKWLGKGRRICDWIYEETGAESLSELSVRSLEHLNLLLDREGVRKYDNWFDHYGWTVRRNCDDHSPETAEMEFCISRQGESRVHRRSNEWVFTLSD